MKTVLFLGHGRAGKDSACAHLASITTLRNAGTTSLYLREYVAQKLNLPIEVAYARRHESDEMRTFWFNAGNELREKGPTTLLRMALANGEITGGLRDREEVLAARAEGLADVIVWVSNNRVKPDPTVMFTADDCDLTIENNGTLGAFFGKIERFARIIELPMRCDRPEFAWSEYGFASNIGVN